MAKSINITDYKARVKLDTKVAVRGLEQLRKAFAKLDAQLGKSSKAGMRRFEDASKVYGKEVDILKTKKYGREQTQRENKSLLRSVDLFIAKNITLAKLKDKDRKAALAFQKKLRDAAVNNDRLGVASLQKQVSLRHQTLSATMRESAIIANTVHSYSRIATFAIAAATAMGTIKTVELGKKYDKSVISLQAALASSNFVTDEMEAGRMNEQERQDFIDKNRKFAYGTAVKYGIDSSAFMSDFARLSVSAMGEGRMSPEEVQVLMQGMAKQSVVFGLSTDETKRALNAFSQMANKGKVSAEELKNQLGDVLPGAMKLFADAMNRSEKELMEMMDRGELLAWDVLPRVAVLLNTNAEAGGALAKAMKEPNKQFDILNSRLSHFAIGTYNQFKKPLSELIQLTTSVVNDIGDPFLEIFGNVLGNLLGDFTSMLNEKGGVVDSIRTWADEWKKLTTEAKLERIREITETVKDLGSTLATIWVTLKGISVLKGIVTIFQGLAAGLAMLGVGAAGGLVAAGAVAITALGTALGTLVGSEKLEEIFGLEMPQWMKDYIDDPTGFGKTAFEADGSGWMQELEKSLDQIFRDLSNHFVDWLIADFKLFLTELQTWVPAAIDTTLGGFGGIAEDTAQLGQGVFDFLQQGIGAGMGYVFNIDVNATQENHGAIDKENADRNMESFKGALTNSMLGVSAAEMATTF